MGGTSSGQLAFVKETVVGTTPATPAFKIIDMTSEDLSLTVNQTRSEAITPQRVVRSSRRTGKEVGNGFSFELYKGAEIDEILRALCGQAAFAGVPLTVKAGGQTFDSFTFERKLSATDYRRFVGCQIGSAEFTIQPEAICQVRVGVTGYSMVTAAAAIAGATYANPTDIDKLTALDVTAITLSNGLTTSLDFENITLTVNNQLTARKRIGPNSVRSISQGQALVTGTARAYVDKTLADAFVADTEFDMDIPFALAGEGYTLLLKDIHITEYNDPNTGNDDEYMSDFSFEATLDTTFGSSFGISKTS